MVGHVYSVCLYCTCLTVVILHHHILYNVFSTIATSRLPEHAAPWAELMMLMFGRINITSPSIEISSSSSGWAKQFSMINNALGALPLFLNLFWSNKTKFIMEPARKTIQLYTTGKLFKLIACETSGLADFPV